MNTQKKIRFQDLRVGEIIHTKVGNTPYEVTGLELENNKIYIRCIINSEIPIFGLNNRTVRCEFLEVI